MQMPSFFNEVPDKMSTSVTMPYDAEIPVSYHNMEAARGVGGYPDLEQYNDMTATHTPGQPTEHLPAYNGRQAPTHTLTSHSEMNSLDVPQQPAYPTPYSASIVDMVTGGQNTHTDADKEAIYT